MTCEASAIARFITEHYFLTFFLALALLWTVEAIFQNRRPNV